MSGFRVCDNTTSHSSGDLTNSNLHFGRRLDDYERTLVLGTRFRQPCTHMTTFLMLGNDDVSFDRIPVGMHIEGRHEDGNLQFLLMEILGFLGGLDHHYASVRRCDDEIGVIDLQHTYRAAEEIGHKNQQHSREDERDSKNPMRLHVQIDRHIDDKKQQYSAGDQSAALSVNPWCFHYRN